MVFQEGLEPFDRKWNFVNLQYGSPYQQSCIADLLYLLTLSANQMCLKLGK